MKKTLKRSCAGFIVWIATLIPVCIVALLMVSLMNPEAIEFKTGKTTSISGSKMEKYEKEKSEFLKFGH